jgi:hypothetical protein
MFSDASQKRLHPERFCETSLTGGETQTGLLEIPRGAARLRGQLPHYC